MALIKIDTDALLSGVAEIKGCVGNIANINSGLSSLIAVISDSWQGSASVGYVGLMNGYTQKAEKMCAVLEEYQAYIEKATETFTKLDNDSANRIRGSF